MSAASFCLCNDNPSWLLTRASYQPDGIKLGDFEMTSLSFGLWKGNHNGLLSPQLLYNMTMKFVKIPPFGPKVLKVALDQVLRTIQAWTLSRSIWIPLVSSSLWKAASDLKHLWNIYLKLTFYMCPEKGLANSLKHCHTLAINIFVI